MSISTRFALMQFVIDGLLFGVIGLVVGFALMHPQARREMLMLARFRRARKRYRRKLLARD